MAGKGVPDVMVGRVAKKIRQQEGKGIARWIGPAAHLLERGRSFAEVDATYFKQRHELKSAQEQADRHHDRQPEQGDGRMAEPSSANADGEEVRRACGDALSCILHPLFPGLISFPFARIKGHRSHAPKCIQAHDQQCVIHELSVPGQDLAAESDSAGSGPKNDALA